MVQGVPREELAGRTGGEEGKRGRGSKGSKENASNLSHVAHCEPPGRHVLKSWSEKGDHSPAKHLTGGLDLPGDKSISHRYAMLAALAEGASELRHFSAAADCHSTLECMSALGAEVKIDRDTVRVTGRGLAGLKSSWRVLDAGNSGTTMRLLSGILAGQPFSSKLTGDGSLQKRPMKRVIGPLREMGAEIRARDDNFAPLEIRGAKLKAIDYRMPMASAQVKSAVLLAGCSRKVSPA